MHNVEWGTLDDYAFVYLTADLLREMGFHDVLVQGDGPDGGLDLVVTEPVRYAVQGVQPFRWGVQCKFSTTGRRRSVSDHEIRDVEGILRSDRYTSLALNGYMLVTNRRVSQNVVERLRGINRHSAFRTAFLDGEQLELRLQDYPAVTARYFSEVGRLTFGFGEPLAEAMQDVDNRIWLPVEVSAPQEPERKLAIRALVDSGAMVSCVPADALQEFTGAVRTPIMVRHITGESTIAHRVLLDLHVGNTCFSTWAIAVNKPYGLLGADILAQLVVLWDGPARSMRVWRASQSPPK